MVEPAGKIQLPPASNLTPEEFQSLLVAAQAGCAAAREQLIEANLRLALSIAQRFSGRAEFDDLFQVACIGLVKAIDNFDLSFNVQFSTYAVPVIMGEIRRFLREEGAIKLGRTLREKAAAVIRVRDSLEQRLGRAPTPKEIGDELGLEREEVIEALEAVAPILSIHDIVHEDSESAIHVEDRLGVEPESEAWLENYALKQACEGLSPRDRAIVVLRFIQERTQSQVAEILGISQGQVSRLEKRITALLRESLMR
ncbi:MAG TPA: SigB/SigF/SigG family RNA polymerase sigma factor [Firmicutes bacterium]|nr:SigB/SigF/SigG family RNA polymerase sigma factor [Bacillota bacterium]